MNDVDSSDHHDTSQGDPAPSLLTVILDTNPHAWTLLQDTLPLSTAVANLLVFINAHLACNYANQVAVVASHTQEAKWLYPTHSTTTTTASFSNTANEDVDMNGTADHPADAPPQASKYRPFHIVEEQLTRNLKELLSKSTPEEVESSTSTMMAGALTLGLSHINRETIAYNEAHGLAKHDSDPSSSGTAAAAMTSSGLPPQPGGSGEVAASSSAGLNPPTGLQSRILIISVSSSTDSAHQYIPIMNSIFACQHLRIPIDICKLTGDAVFLQQACDATRGIYMSVTSPRGFLQYLMLAFLPDQRARRHLILPTRVDVDFRAACFCHRKVVDIGFVCSICLSIFCEPPEGARCLTCGTELELGEYGAKPVVVTRKKKRKKGVGKSNGVSSGAATPTPTPTPTPMP